MFKAIVFKEWLKIRWAYAGLVLLSLLVLGDITLNLMHDFRFEKATTVWARVVFKGVLFYANLRYIPLLAGIVVSVAQFVPEATSARLKLSLHLPLRENNVVLWMLIPGFVALVLLELAVLALLSVITSTYFPSEVLWSVIVTTVPWFLAGIAGYCAVSAIVIEPKWWKRALLAVLGYGAIQPFLVEGRYSICAPVLPYLFLVTSFWTIAALLSAHRFRRGVR